MIESVKFPIYSIGHGNRTIDVFFDLLNEYKINYLIDVRTNPFSRFNPNFNRAILHNICKERSVFYVFMGDSLGGKPKNRSCYDEEGYVIYEKIMETEEFIYSINRLITAYNKNLRVACMCSELKPCECHRSKMIGRYLSAKNIDFQHIDEKGGLISQDMVVKQVTNGYDQDLFGNKFEFKSTGAY